MRKFEPVLLMLVCAAPAFAAKIDVSTSKSNAPNWQASEVLNDKTFTLPANYIGPTLYGNVPGLKFPFGKERKVGPNDGFWYADFAFTLPDGAIKPKLHLFALGADDRAVVELNGAIISDGGSGGPGSGFMTFTDGGANERHVFMHGVGAQSVTSSKGFVAGTNDLRLIVNNTGQGIQGEPIVKIKGNPTNVGITGYVSFQNQSTRATSHRLTARLLP